MYRAADDPKLIRVVLNEVLESRYFDEKSSFGWKKDGKEWIEPNYLFGASEIVDEGTHEDKTGTVDEHCRSEAAEERARLRKESVQTEP